ncbi:MAG: UbiA family prenyltransferase [Planctomycetes bacterium]|nr:UbiA family prenyltransferase [Planctomycetota bacterium]
MRPRTFFELVRLPLTPTALADSLAGYFLACAYAAPLTPEPPVKEMSLPWSFQGLVLTLAVSVLSYWLGMVTNDFFDREKDRQAIQSRRPLARGEVSARQALALAAALGAAAALMAWAGGILHVFALLLLAILLYNGGGKKLPVLGNVLMGSCRSFNFLLGTAAKIPLASLLNFPFLAFAAAFTGLYVALVTALSRLEDRPYHPQPIARLVVILLSAPVGLLLGSWRNPFVWGNSLLFFAVLFRALKLPAPETWAAAGTGQLHPAAGAVRAGLTGLYFLNAGYLHSHGLWAPACLIYGLVVLGWLWKRLWVQSGLPF